MGLVGLSRTGSARARIERELELVCGIKCARIVDLALKQADMRTVPEQTDALRAFIYYHLKHQLLRHYKDDEVVDRLIEVVGTALIIETGVFRLPATEGRMHSDSQPEIRPPQRMSLPPGPRTGALADVALTGGRKRK